ncbi:MAG: 50S ribosomal protein L1 [Kiritimatiellaeota bacterium]|nr:50S ribosomal protein L1 [Kiritimatiellota bacterium]
MSKSKLYKSQLEMVEEDKLYPISEAFELLKKMPHTKFDESVDVAIRLGIDPRQSDQNVRGAVSLPKGTGKNVVVAVVAADAAGEQAKEAGAEHVGMEDLIAKIKDGWLGFDVLIATPEAMKQVRPLGRVLGPRGLMPNPKTGTVTDDVVKAVNEAKAGRVEFRADKGGCAHAAIGKLSFPVEDLLENCIALLQALIRAKPATAKGTYIQKCAVSSTMSPCVKIDATELLKVL